MRLIRSNVEKFYSQDSMSHNKFAYYAPHLTTISSIPYNLSGNMNMKICFIKLGSFFFLGWKLRQSFARLSE